MQIEPRYVNLTETCFVAPPEKIAAACDKNTIGVVGILGTTYSGHYEDIAGIDKVVGTSLPTLPTSGKQSNAACKGLLLCTVPAVSALPHKYAWLCIPTVRICCSCLAFGILSGQALASQDVWHIILALREACPEKYAPSRPCHSRSDMHPRSRTKSDRLHLTASGQTHSKT